MGITRYDDMRDISRRPDVWSSVGGIRPESGPTGMMMEQDDPVHRQRRQLVSKGFAPLQIRRQEDKVRSIVDRLLDRVIDQRQCDFVTDVAAWLPLVMIADALGFEEADHPMLLKWSDDLMRGLGQDDPERVGAMMVALEGYTSIWRDSPTIRSARHITTAPFGQSSRHPGSDADGPGAAGGSTDSAVMTSEQHRLFRGADCSDLTIVRPAWQGDRP